MSKKLPINDETIHALYAYLANVSTAQSAGVTRELAKVRASIESRDLKAAYESYALAVDGLLAIGSAMKHARDATGVVPDGIYAPWRETEPVKRLDNEMAEMGEVPVITVEPR